MQGKLIQILIILLIVVSCDNDRVHFPPDYGTEELNEKKLTPEIIQTPEEVLDSLYALKDLVNVQTLDPRIRIDLKYASEDNFLKQKVYLKINRAYLQRDVAVRLARCQEYLSSIDTSLHLLIYDALRPVSVQKRMWDALDSIPPVRRGAYVSSPWNKSLHNYGAAIDLTICKSDGTPLDMGAGFDDFREIAYPSKEMHFYTTGELTDVHLNNRKLLRKVMRKEGFRNLPTEWWHFNACSRSDAAEKYQFLEEEL